MSSFPNEIGNRFGRLVVLRSAGSARRSKGSASIQNSRAAGRKWLCRCDCGRQIVVHGQKLRNGRVRECLGCQDITSYYKELEGESL